MKHLYSMALVALVGLTGAGCSTLKPPATELAADATCRKVIAGGEKEQVVCGSAAQWAEFDRRAEFINSGVTCRWVRTPRELCMFPEQWARFDSRRREFNGRDFAVFRDNTTPQSSIDPLTGPFATFTPPPPPNYANFTPPPGTPAPR